MLILSSLPESAKHDTKTEPIPSEERKYLENIHNGIVCNCVVLEDMFQKTLKDTVTIKEELQLLRKGQVIVQELLSELKKGERKLEGLSYSDSVSSIESSDGSEIEDLSPSNSVFSVDNDGREHRISPEGSLPCE